MFKTQLGDPEPEDQLLYAGLDSNSRYDYESSSSNLTTDGITYFTWDRNIFGPYCIHSMYEDDGGGTETISFTLTNPETNINTTVSDTRPKNNADMGTVTFLFDDPLTTQRFTNDFRIQMQ